MLTVVRPAAPLQDAAGARRRGEPGGPQRPDADPRGGQARPRGPRLLPPPVRRRPQSQGDNLIKISQDSQNGCEKTVLAVPAVPSMFCKSFRAYPWH